jgi:hypothetical protein
MSFSKARSCSGEFIRQSTNHMAAQVRLYIKVRFFTVVEKDGRGTPDPQPVASTAEPV